MLSLTALKYQKISENMSRILLEGNIAAGKTTILKKNSKINQLKITKTKVKTKTKTKTKCETYLHGSKLRRTALCRLCGDFFKVRK